MSEQPSYLLITGAAGFIASRMARHLNELGFHDLILVDDFGVEAKRANWESIQAAHIVERHSLFEWLDHHQPVIACFIHLGARTDTTEFDYSIHEELNVAYSQQVWRYCSEHHVPLIYASSAATYGAGEHGYNDDHTVVQQLQPLNPYGVSKNEFDKWALAQDEQPPYWAGLKFFNVYGPDEYHKGRMASVIWHAFNQIKERGDVRLFKSHRAGIADGEQLRDFVYVQDVVKVMAWMCYTMMKQEWKSQDNGLFNLGTGKARSFADLAKATFSGMDMEPNIVFIDMPEDIRDKYQYFTEANMSKLRSVGYIAPFYTLEEGVDDYVRNYLQQM